MKYKDFNTMPVISQGLIYRLQANAHFERPLSLTPPARLASIAGHFAQGSLQNPR